MPFPATTINKTTIDGFTYSHSATDTGNGFEGLSVTVLPAKPGHTTGAAAIALDPGHGLTGFVPGDVFWAGGYRSGETWSVAGNVLTSLGGGTGDPLPPVNTPVAVSVPVVYPVDVDGDKAQAVAAYGGAVGLVAFNYSGGSVPVPIRSAGDGPVWLKSSGVANPLAGLLVGGIQFSHAASSPQPMRAAVVLE